MRRFPLIHTLTSAPDNAFAVAHDDIVPAHAHRLDQSGTGDCRRPSAVHDDLDLRKLAARNFARIDQASSGDDRGPVLIVVHHGNVHLLLECLFNDKAFGGLDILQIDPAKARFHQSHGIDEGFRVFGREFDINRINVGEAFEKDCFSFHYRLRRQRTKIAEAEDCGAVGNDRDQIALGRIIIGCCRVRRDGEDGDRDAGRISERKVTLCRHRFGGDDLNLSGPSSRVIEKRFPLRKLHL